MNISIVSSKEVAESGILSAEYHIQLKQGKKPYTVQGYAVHDAKPHEYKRAIFLTDAELVKYRSLLKQKSELDAQLANFRS